MSFDHLERRSLGTIASLYLIRMLGLFLVLPVLSVYGQDLDGASSSLIGLALGIYGLSQAVLQIPFGIASDKFGRKIILIIGFVLFVFGSVICALADNIYILIVGRAVQGAGAVSAVLLALIGDSISEGNRTTSMAIIGVSIGLSFGLSVVFSPIIAESFDGLESIFYLSAFLGLLALALVLFAIPKSTLVSKLDIEKVGALSAQKKPKSVFSPNLLRMDLSIFLLHFMQMCIWVAVPSVLIDELQIELNRHWLVYMATVGGGFILMAPFMRLWDKRGKTKTAILVAISCIALSLFLMAQVSIYWVFLIGLFGFFWGFNLLEATLPSTVTKLVNPEEKGFASGIYSSCQFLGVFFGGVIGGLVLSKIGLSAVFYLSGSIGILWMLSILPANGLNKISKHIE